MGSAISKIREEVTSASGGKQLQTECLETLKALETMANDYMNAFYQKIENSANDAKKIPIDRVLTKHIFVRCYDSKSDDLGKAIRDEINDIASGPVGLGLANLATSVFQMLLGASAGQRSVDERYAISLGDCLGLSRLDICFFTYKFQSESLYRMCESVMACCIVVSSANINDINENTIRVLVNNGFAGSPRQLKNLICDEMIYRVIRKPSPVEIEEDYHAHRIAMKKYLDEMDYGKRKGKAKAKPEASSALLNNSSATQQNAASLVPWKGVPAPPVEGEKNQTPDGTPAPAQR